MIDADALIYLLRERIVAQEDYRHYTRDKVLLGKSKIYEMAYRNLIQDIEFLKGDS